MKKIILASLALILLTFTFWYYHRKSLGATITIGKNTFKIELALTNAQKEKGLAYRDSLPADTGMLFPYDHPDRYTFWMKGMRFPLDFIWINGNYVADITINVPVISDGQPLPTYEPKVPVDKVFEINAGMAALDGIKIGDLVKISE